MAATPSALQVACLQTHPVFQRVSENQKTADSYLKDIEPGSLDLLVLPEMAFTGYCFADKDEIAPYLESRQGSTVDWAQRTARSLQCAVMVGFPEREDDVKAFNSLVLVAANGEDMFFHRKKHLYETDESWACEGAEWSVFELFVPSLKRSIRICPSICMDLNPWRFISPFENFEFASFALQQKADVVVCCMNWLVSDEQLPATASAWQRVSSTISYFLLRLSPLLATDTAFIACNRVGGEQLRGADAPTTFTGSSCLVELGDRPVVKAFAPKEGTCLIRGSINLP